MTLNLILETDHAELIIDNPPQNLLSPELLQDSIKAIDSLAEEDPPLLLLRSRGPHFSAGYPIDRIPEEIFHTDADKRRRDPFERLMQRLVAYPQPVIAEIQGDAWGGAVELLSCADLRVAVTTVRFAVPALRLGLIYSHTGLRRMAAAFGGSVVREMVLTGEPIDAARAQATGFVNRLVAHEDLHREALKLLRSVARGAPAARAGTRRILRWMDEVETFPEEWLAEIAELRHEAWLSDDFREAQAAFLAKRKPDFARKGD